DLRRPPTGIFPLQSHNHRFKLRRQSIRLAMRPPAAIAERLHATVFVAVENLVAGLSRDPELGAQRRHLLPLEHAGDKPAPSVHDVTLLPRHAPSCGGAKVSPMCPEYRVTYVSGRTFARVDIQRELRRDGARVLLARRLRTFLSAAQERL